MNCWRFGCAVGFFVALLGGGRSVLAVDGAAVDAAMARAQHWLIAQQKGGNWENWATGYEAQKTGWTALALDALLASGINSQDASVAPAITYLKATDTDGVYALGLRMQVWQRLPNTPDVRHCAYVDAMKLLNGVGRKGDEAGMWGYVVGKGGYSHSRSQYGVLGMTAARQMGIDVPDGFWKLLKTGWMDHQLPEGGWTYQKTASDTHPPTAGMTTAGVASLLLAEEALNGGESLECRGTAVQPELIKSLKWLADHSNEIANGDATPRNYPFAALYGVERVGAAGGIKYFGSVDWYAKGVDWLLKEQKPGGNWTQLGEDDNTMSNLVNTSFAMLFLAHGRAPIFMNKLDYSTDPTKPAGWNQRPRDVAHLAKRAGQELEQELNWQVVTLDSPVADYHDAPILYISGSETLKLSTQAKAKLRDFMNGGGLIVANADCGGVGFANSFRKLSTEITPYEFRNLPKDHPIFTRQQYPASRWKTKPNLLGLSNGVRELMILIPYGDPGKTWELDEVKGHESAFELGADLFEYVASRNKLRSRGESYLVKRDDSITATSSIKVGRIQYAGNWDPEPGGWNRLANIMHNRSKVDLDVSTMQAKGDMTGAMIGHLTGTETFHPGDETLRHIHDFVQNGGTLVVDAAGGCAPFAVTVRGELVKMFGSDFKVLAPEDPVYCVGGLKPPVVHYRDYANETRGILKQPRIEGLRIGNRIAVFFSADDLSAGLVGQQVDGILGYDPESATDLMTRILVYAAQKH